MDQPDDQHATSPAPDGFSLIPDAVSEETWKILHRWLESEDHMLEDEHVPIPWQIGAQDRKVAQFGFRYDYDKDIVDTTTPTPPIPLKLKQLLLQQHQKGGDDVKYTQCIINQYEREILIPWHKDDLEFGPKISVFTFGEARPLLLRRPREAVSNEYDMYTAAVPTHRSNYILSKRARYDWEHMIPPGFGHRVSFTFRTHKTEAES
jgi:alkylated DNA repair dioxygenase AlkB